MMLLCEICNLYSFSIVKCVAKTHFLPFRKVKSETIFYSCLHDDDSFLLLIQNSFIFDKIINWYILFRERGCKITTWFRWFSIVTVDRNLFIGENVIIECVIWFDFLIIEFRIEFASAWDVIREWKWSCYQSDIFWILNR